MSVLEFRVAHFDRYYDIPLRGIVEDRGACLPFIAQVDEGAPESAWSIGIPAKIAVYPVTEQLGPIYEAVTRAFRLWNARFRRGEVPENSHPQKVDADYQSKLRAIDSIFRELEGRSKPYDGFFSVKEEVWCFRAKDSG